METWLAIGTGLGLAAATGLRVFLPLFIVSLAANTGVDLPLVPDSAVAGLLGGGFDWLGSDWVTIALGIATVVEVGAFYLPLVDNLLDVVATPLAVIAGTVVSGAFLPEIGGDGFQWLAAVIAGGGTAGTVQGLSMITRGTTTVTTGGLGNPILSTVELLASIVTTLLSIVLPILALALIVVVLVLGIRAVSRRRPRAEPY